MKRLLLLRWKTSVTAAALHAGWTVEPAGPVVGWAGVARAHSAVTSFGLEPACTSPAAAGHARASGTGLQTPDYLAVPRAVKVVVRPSCRERCVVPRSCALPPPDHPAPPAGAIP